MPGVCKQKRLSWLCLRQNGDTLLHRAIKGGHRLEGLVRLLLQFGANPDIPDRV